jgi:hypothetical protein
MNHIFSDFIGVFMDVYLDCWNIQGRLSRPKFEFPYMVYKYVHAFYRLATGLGATLQ